jgi:predicted transcriptional regulator of viral defense system
MTEGKNKSVALIVDEFQSKGRYSFTRSELVERCRCSDVALKAALRRLRARGRIAIPRRGFYVVVPIEYRSAGCPPASWFVDDLMRDSGQPYYVGILSAAAIHGAAHQQPMTFQVVTDNPTRPAVAGRVRIEFHVSRSVEASPTADVQTYTGTMRVATPELTAFDLVRYTRAAGHLSNVATVLAELAEAIDPGRLVELASAFKVTHAQRLGYLLDLVGQRSLSDPLAAWLRNRRARAVPLRGGGDATAGGSDNRWRVLPNEAVEVDV